MKLNKFIAFSGIALGILSGSLTEVKAGLDDERDCISNCSTSSCKKRGGLLSKGADWCVKTCSDFIGRPGRSDAHAAISDCLDSVAAMGDKDKNAVYDILKKACPTCPTQLGGIKADSSGVVNF